MEKFVWVPLKKSGAQSSPTYGLAKVAQEISQNQVLVQFVDNKLSQQKVDKSEVLPAASQVVENLASLDQINEPSVLNNVVKRYLNDLPYTYCGPALLFANSSLSSLEKVLSEKALTSSLVAPTQETLEHPHLFQFANKVYNDMIQSYQNQTIVLAGRSGSGKSYNLKKLLQFFGSLAANKRQNELLRNASSVLEVFANARTSHSESSSRHQQVIDVQFDACGRVHGANFWSFNIELDRLLSQRAGESNFEIFYLIQQDEELRNKYQLQQNFTLLSEAKKPSSSLSELKDSLNNIGFTSEELEDVWKILAALLHLGNLQYVGSALKDREPINVAASLLGVDSAALERGASSQQSLYNTIKSIYERLFSWIVKKINQALTPSAPVKYSISIVDTTGFESYKQNGVYQLYVNYLNEKLRQMFVDNVFKDVQDYVQEDLDLSELEYIDSDHTVMNIIEKQNGILNLLEKTSSLEGTTSALLAKQIVASNSQNEEVFKGMGGTSFSLTHYSSETTYDTTGWVENNLIVLPFELGELLSTSSNLLLKAISQSQSSATNVAQQFRSNARKMTTILESFVAPYYLIALKPNVSLSFEMDHTFVLDQLFEYGITETAQVYKQGYQARLSLKDFLKRYHTPEKKEALLTSQKERKATARTLLQSAGVDESQYAIGNTKVFLKDTKALSKVATYSEQQDLPLIECTQARFRGIMSRRQTNKLMEQAISAALIQRNWRSYVQLKDWNWRQLYIAALPHTSAMKQDVESEKVREELAYYRRRKAEQDNEKVTENNEKRELQIQLAELELENKLEREVLNEVIRKYEREYRKYEDFADSSYKEHLMGEEEQKLLVLMEEIDRKKRMLSELEEIQKQLGDLDEEVKK